MMAIRTTAAGRNGRSATDLRNATGRTWRTRVREYRRQCNSRDVGWTFTLGIGLKQEPHHNDDAAREVAAKNRIRPICSAAHIHLVGSPCRRGRGHARVQHHRTRASECVRPDCSGHGCPRRSLRRQPGCTSATGTLPKHASCAGSGSSLPFGPWLLRLRLESWTCGSSPSDDFRSIRLSCDVRAWIEHDDQVRSGMWLRRRAGIRARTILTRKPGSKPSQSSTEGRPLRVGDRARLASCSHG